MKKTTWLWVKASLIICFMTLPFARRAFATNPPNVIIILTDDQGYGDLSCYGATGFQTPAIDSLAAEGIRFTSYYSPSAVCSPARAGLLTRCYPPRVGVPKVLAPEGRSWANSVKNDGLHPQEVTIADMLKTKGYATACVGKWHLGHHKVFLPLNQGFDEFFGIPYSNDIRPETSSDWPSLPLIDGYKTVETDPDQTHFTRRFTERSIDFINRSVNANKPFFLYLAQPMPHIPLYNNPRFDGKSKQGKYGDVMMELDWSVGQIRKQLDSLGVEDNTLIIFTSDNGPWTIFGNHGGSPGPLRGYKRSAYEAGHRVPCIMYWPDSIPKGQVSDEMISGIDLLPTIARISGASLPVKKIDGKDIMPVMRGQGASPHEALYFFVNSDLAAVRMRDWKMMYSVNQEMITSQGSNGTRGTSSYSSPPLSLYNLATDSGETTNLRQSMADTFNLLKSMGDRFKSQLNSEKRATGNATKLSPPMEEPFRWEFDASLVDSSSNAKNLTKVGQVSYVDGKFGKAVSFSPQSSGALQVSAKDGSGFFHGEFSTRSVSAWINARSTTHKGVIYEEGGMWKGMALMIDNDSMAIGVFHPDTTGRRVYKVPFTVTNKWVHVGAIFNSGLLELFIDSVKVLSKTVPYAAIGDHSSDAVIGASLQDHVFGTNTSSGSPELVFDGLIDRVLVHQEIFDFKKPTVKVLAAFPNDKWEEESLDSAIVALKLEGCGFKPQVSKNDLLFYGLPTGVSIEGVTYLSIDSISIPIAFDGTDFDADTSITIKLKASGGTCGRDLTSSGFMVKAKLEVAPTPVKRKDAYLKSLSVSIGDLTPAFDATVFAYSIGLPSGSALPVVSAIANDTNASVQIIPFGAMSDTAVVTVTAEDSTVTQQYKLHIKEDKGTVTYVPEVQVIDDVKVYPNPSSAYIMIDGAIGQKYILTSLAGESLVSGSIDSNNYKLAVVGIPAGVYVLTVDGRVFKVKKL